jgi:hypothetical protein
MVVNRNALAKLNKSRAFLATKFYLVEDIWTVMKELEVERNKSYTSNYLNKQNSLDPEKTIHNPNLYAVWNLKSYTVNKVAKENPFGSEFFIFTDAGAWRRAQPLKNWPNTAFISQTLAPWLNNRILFGQIGTFDLFSEHKNIIEGTFFAGSQKAIFDFYERHFEIHDSRMKRGFFVGKDQTIMNLLAFKYYRV